MTDNNEITTTNIIVVKINGKDYDTKIDPDGVQRFVGDTLVKYLRLCQYIDLNLMYKDFYSGKIALEDYQRFYIMIGYSVAGFDEIFGVSGLRNFEEYGLAEIENPLWD